MKRILILLCASFILPACDSPEKKPSPIEPVAKTPVVAMASENVDLLVGAPTRALLNEIVSFKPTADHHFEMEAPQKCGKFEFQKKSPRELSCQLAEAGSHEIALSICNDAKEYCKRSRFTVNVDGNSGVAMIPTPGSGGQNIQQPAKFEHEPVEGFLINTPDDAEKQAKAADKLIFIHFYGIWCPPCNLLEENVYGQPEFLKTTDDMVRLMLDADSDISWKWKARFKIGGYPTVIIANSELEEIGRVVGYRTPRAMSDWVSETAKNREVTLRALTEKHPTPETADADVKARVGRWHYERGEWAKANEWLVDHPDDEARKYSLLAQVGIAKDSGDNEAELNAVRLLTQQFPQDIKFASWALRLHAANPESSSRNLVMAMENLKLWGTSEKLDQTGYAQADLAWLRATVLEAMGDKASAKEAYLEAASHYEIMAKASNMKTARGANMERAYALHKADENEQAKALYAELAKTYPNEFTFNYDYAYVLKELKEFKPAYDYAKRAEINAYGDNWLRAIRLKAEIELALGKFDVAKDTVDGALVEVVIPSSTANRTHRYVAALRKLSTKISAKQLEASASYSLVLTGIRSDQDKPKVIAAVREIIGKDGKSDQEIIDGIPLTLITAIPKDLADKFRNEVESAGGSIELK